MAHAMFHKNWLHYDAAPTQDPRKLIDILPFKINRVFTCETGSAMSQSLPALGIFYPFFHCLLQSIYAKVHQACSSCFKHIQNKVNIQHLITSKRTCKWSQVKELDHSTGNVTLATHASMSHASERLQQKWQNIQYCLLEEMKHGVVTISNIFNLHKPKKILKVLWLSWILALKMGQLDMWQV